MGKRVYCYSKKAVFNFSMGIFSIFTVFLIFMGSFFWEGGNTAYLETEVILRGLEMLGAVGLLFLGFWLISKRLEPLDEQRILAITALTGAIMVLLQFVFVAAAKAGIRYDALKVFDEALALFSQKGIQAGDLEGYFARYSNNYAMTIMTHWLIKIFRAIGIVHEDFSNGVLVLQFVNVIFVDAALCGAWMLVKKYAGTRSAGIFMIYTALNPLTYVWLPFYYTNTCSMAFAVWGAYLLLSVFCKRGKTDGWKYGDVCKCALAGILFAVGFEIRATTAIALIAALIVIFCAGKKKAAVCLLIIFIALGITEVVYSQIEDHYLAFDERDTAFPMTHWIAMGLSDTGTFSPADEAYTMSFATGEEKQEAALSLLKERASALGPFGVGKLYFKKLAMTFGDGAGGYHSELSLSRDYGWLWQVVYGVHRDPLLAVTQVFYLLSLISGLGMAVFLWKKKLPEELFFLPLFLLGSYLFQMIWEAGTIYSIGTMYVNGCMAAVFIPMAVPHGMREKKEQEKTEQKSKNGTLSKDKKFGKNEKRMWKRIIFGSSVALCVFLSALLVRRLAVTEYVEVSMSVDQFLFQANEYIAISDGMEVSQTFVTDKEFSTIAFQMHNPEGEYNDSLYSISLYEEGGSLIKEQILQGSLAEDYTFYPLAFENREGISNYEIRIKKLSGKHDLIFLYYDTGHYDVYPQGKLTGLTKGDKGDLIFEVYWREEE